MESIAQLSKNIKSIVSDIFPDNDGELSPAFQDAETQSGNPMIIVYGKHVARNVTSHLFEIVFQEPETTRYTVFILDGNVYFITTTPKEYPDKVEAVFALDEIKGKIAHLKGVGQWASA